jgi:cyclopropane-fatty-acyl-phospholipid synthase
LAGEWDSPDIASLLEIVARNTEGLRDFFAGKPLAQFLNRIFHLLNRNSKAGSKRNIMAHYDLGNGFYKRWLDPSMTYSSARYERPGQDLAEAQHNKYRALAQRMQLGPDHHVLEIGCGWGGFAEFAAKEVGARVTGITISPEQYDFARKRLFEQGLADKADIRLQDYRDTSGHFDRVASIEMFEAVGEKYWPAYFQKVHDVLKPGGHAGLQIITISDAYFDVYRRSVDFIQKYVFPGGMLPSPSALQQQVSQAGLTWRGEDRFGRDYAETLADWHRRFTAAWDDIRAMGFDERFRRLWTYYLSYCEAGFRAGSIDVTQIALQK